MRPRKTGQALCPSCRAQRRVRLVGIATVARQPVSLAQCQAPDCELIWAVREGALINASAHVGADQPSF